MVGGSAWTENVSKTTQLIEHVPHLPQPALNAILDHLRSDDIVTLPDRDKLELWDQIVNLVSRHRRFAQADWAMNSNLVNEIDEIAQRLAPKASVYRHQRLFSDRDFELYEEKGSYDEQQKELEERRQKAILEIFTEGGVGAVLEFARAVESPWRVGYPFGAIAAKDSDSTILPDLLDSEIKALGQFTGGFVWWRFRLLGWQWVDEIDTSKWSATQKGQFLAYLPFKPATWNRAARLLSGDEAPYWSKANANPYEPEKNLEFAIDRLVEHGRAYAAVRCLQKILREEKLLDSQQAVRVLKAVSESSEDPHSLDVDAIVAVITALQENPDTSPDDLFQIEWVFLPVLDRHHGAGPRALEQRLAESRINNRRSKKSRSRQAPIGYSVSGERHQEARRMAHLTATH